VVVYGLGTQDDSEYAKRFLDQVGVSHTLLWDESGLTWRHFGIRLQPEAVLVAPDGTVIDQWRGLPFDEIAAKL
jgi:hypothetical protein